jgi:hypothetical protein
MQRRSYIAVLLTASLLPLAAHAQRGFGGRGSISSQSRSGPAFAPRSFPAASAFGPHSAGSFGPHSMGAPPRALGGSRVFVPNRAFVPRSGVRISSGFGNGFRRFRDFDDFRFHRRLRDFDDFRFGRRFRDFDDFRFRRPFFFGGGCFNRFNPFCNQFFFGSTLGFGGSFGYAPYYPAYPVDYAYQPPPQQVVVERDDNSRELSLEVERLSDEVQLLRDEDIRLHNESRSAALQNQGSMSAQQPPAYTVLVFRDGHKVSVQNYAITGNTLWIINERAAQKVSLSDLDIPATEQANSVNGVEFKIPSAPQSH